LLAASVSGKGIMTFVSALAMAKTHIAATAPDRDGHKQESCCVALPRRVSCSQVDAEIQQNKKKFTPVVVG
jgi:hypothetical protein